MRFLYQNLKELPFRKKRKTFLEHIKPMIILGRIFGCIFFDLGENPALVNVLLSLPLPLVYIYSCLDAWFIHKGLPTTPSTKYLLVSDVLSIAGSTLNVILQTGLYFVKRKRFKKFFLDVERANEALGIKDQVRYSLNFSSIVFITLVTITTTSYLLIVHYSPTISMDFTHFAYITMNFHISHVGELISFTLLQEVRKQFAVINGKLGMVIERSTQKDKPIDEVHHLVERHKQLCKYCLDFNNFLGIIIITSFAMNMLAMVQSCHFGFSLLMNFVKGKSVDAYLGTARCIKMFMGLGYIILKLMSWIGVRKEV